jgi:pimeloyl-ACP methyl ester carboxylesterase
MNSEHNRDIKPMTSRQISNIRTGHVRTSDGVTLHYLEAGSGPPLVLIPGWSQTAAMFQPQLKGLTDSCRILALDMRGHGKSEKPEYGYRIARLAKDLHEALVALDLEDVNLAGHSMGCAVIWSYWDQFGDDRLKRLILIDQPSKLLRWPHWTDTEWANAGSRLDATALMDFIAQLIGPEGIQVSKDYISSSFFTPTVSPNTVEWVINENLQFPRHLAARLLVDLYAQDWRDVLPRITLPTLVVGGEASLFNPQSQRWNANQIPQARLEMFAAEEGGSHFMWLENPQHFNALLREFIQA